MATTAPMVEWADRAAARARQAATIPEICSAFPAVIERRPKILRLGDKSGPLLCGGNCRSRDYRKRISVSQRSIAVTTARSGTPTLKRQLVHVAIRISPFTRDSGRVVGKQEVIRLLPVCPGERTRPG